MKWLMIRTMNRIIKKLIFIIIILFSFLSCGKKVEKIEKSKFLFGTYIRIGIWTDNNKNGNKALELAFNEIERVDNKFNSKVKGSLIERLNTGKVNEILLDNEGIYLFNELKNIYEISGKKYDVTIAPLVEIWDFGKGEKGALPSDIEIEKAKKRVDFSKIIIKGNKLSFSEKGLEIDTGSFLKGYAIEKAKKVLKDNGIKSAMITSISSIATIGEKPNGKPWIIGLENPDNTEKIIEKVELRGESMGVSGDYQTYVMISGKRYHHILDKNTGFPIEGKKMVAVITDNAFFADMYSTAFFTMEISDVLKFAKEKNIKVIIVDSNGKIINSGK